LIFTFKTASLCLGIPFDKIGKNSEERSIGKTLNFALIYGASAFRLWKEAFETQGKTIDYVELLRKEFLPPILNIKNIF